MLVPTLDGAVTMAPPSASAVAAASASAAAVSASAYHLAQHNAAVQRLPLMAAVAAAASAEHQKDVVTSPTADEVQSLASVVAAMGLDPDAAVCELWFPKYSLVASKRYEVLLPAPSASEEGAPSFLSIVSAASALDDKTHPNSSILIDALRLRLVRHYEGLARQRALLALASSAANTTASAAAAKSQGGGGGGASAEKEQNKNASQQNHQPRASPFAGLSLRQQRELAALKVREKAMKNLSLIGDQDDAFDVASDEEGDEGRGANDEANDGTVSSGEKKKGSAPSGASAAGGASATKEEDEADDEAALFKRAFRAEARRALGGGAGAMAGILSASGGAGADGAPAATMTQTLHAHASRVALSLLGLSEPLRADDDLYLVF